MAIIDEADAAAVGHYNWNCNVASHAPNAVYAMSRINGRPVRLHAFLWRAWGMDPTDDIDHINRNGLDCRRDNLRAATHQQNMCNLGKRSTNTSGFTGVRFDKRTGRWAAIIGHKGKNVWLGRHDTPEEANAAYVEAARHLRGAFCAV